MFVRPPFPQLQNVGDLHGAYLTGLLRRLPELKQIEHLQQGMAYSKCSVNVDVIPKGNLQPITFLSFPIPREEA